MRAAFNNADRAVEYLLSGIPAEPQTIPTRTPVSASPVPASGTPFSAANPSGASNAQTQDSPLAFLRSHPQFGMLKAVVSKEKDLNILLFSLTPKMRGNFYLYFYRSNKILLPFLKSFKLLLHSPLNFCKSSIKTKRYFFF